MDKELQKEDEQITTFGCGRYFERERENVRLLAKQRYQLRVDNTGNEVMNVFTKRPLKIITTPSKVKNLLQDERFNYFHTCSNILRNSAKDACIELTNLIKNSKCRYTITSLGANANLNEMNPKKYAENLCDEVKEFIYILSSRSISIGVRGEFTYDVLQELGVKNVDCIGCPSWFVNMHNQPEIIKKTYSKDLSCGCFSAYISDNWCKKIISQALEYKNPSFIMQHEYNIIPYYFLTKYPATFMRRYLINFDAVRAMKILNERYGVSYFSQIFNSKLRNLFEVFTNIDTWMGFIRTKDFVFGSRIHGAVMAIKAGVPAFPIAFDSRIKELCDLFKLPYIRTDEISCDEYHIQKIYEETDFSEMNKVYPVLLNNYLDFLKKNGVEVLLENETNKNF